jgi:hypothetical protein
MHLMPSSLRAADVLGGALWCATYILILRRSRIDQAPGIPLAALAPAFAWETIFGVLRPTHALPPAVVPAWLFLDALLLGLYLRHGVASQRARGGAAAGVVARTAASVLCAGALEWAYVIGAKDRDGATSGFAVNAVMSLAFVDMLHRRRDIRGQSMYVAVAKLAGSAATIPHAIILHGASPSLRVFIALSLLCDAAYAVFLHRACRAVGVHPWSRL